MVALTFLLVTSIEIKTEQERGEENEHKMGSKYNRIKRKWEKV